MKPVISVLVPSRNRGKYLLSLISILEKCPDDRIEFLISDNSDLPLESLAPRKNINFFRPEQILNMTDHWNFLLNKASGKYVTYLGDDDALIPSSLIKLCDILENSDPDLVWTRTAGYGWPQNGMNANFTQIIKRNSARITLQKARSKVLSLKYLDVPIPYNYAVVKRQLILDFLATYPGEKFFSSRVPDINSGVKILFLSRTQLDFRELTFISGASPLSNGLLIRTNKDHPATLVFNNPEFNPVGKRPNARVTEINPFGFMTYFEAIEESLLQLGQRITSRQHVIAFRSVFSSSFPSQQLPLSLKIWPRNKNILKLAHLMRLLLNLRLFSVLSKKGKLTLLMLKVVLRRIDVVIIQGPGINDTASLVDYLENNSSAYKKKFVTKIHVK